MFVITGGTSGIGEALARSLSLQGHEVLIIGRRLALLEKISSENKNISFCQADLSTYDGIIKIKSYITTYLADNNKFIKGLIHNAATIEPITKITDLDLTSWNNFLFTNITAPLFLTKELLNMLNGAKVLHIGTKAAYFPIYGWSGYCVSKAGLSMLNRCWQLEIDGNIYFSSVMPGIIDTDMQQIIRDSENMDSEKKQYFKKLHKENKLLKPDTVAKFLSWLLLDVKNADFINNEWDIYDITHHKNWLPSSTYIHQP